MRILKYTMVDFFKIKRKIWIMAVLVMICALCLGSSSSSALVTSLIYCLFAGIIVGGMPYYYEKAEEMGLFFLLPGKTEEQIYGHFFFGFLSVLGGLLIGLLCWGIGSIFHLSHGFFEIAGLSGISEAFKLSLLLFGAGLFCVAIQDLLCTIFRFESVQVMNVLRILPGFVFFFGLSTFAASEGSEKLIRIVHFLFSHSGVVFLAFLFFFCLIAYISSQIAKSRE